MSTKTNFTLIFFVILGGALVVFVIAVFATLRKKNSEATRNAGFVCALFALVGVLIGFAGLGVNLFKESQDKSQIYQDILGDNPGMEIKSLDASTRSLTYVRHGSDWPLCFASYKSDVNNHYVVDAESVYCQVNRPKAQPGATTTTSPATTTTDVQILPTSTTTPAS